MMTVENNTNGARTVVLAGAGKPRLSYPQLEVLWHVQREPGHAMSKYCLDNSCHEGDFLKLKHVYKALEFEVLNGIIHARITGVGRGIIAYAKLTGRLA